MESVFSFILLIMFVLFIGALGMWAMQKIAIKVGKSSAPGGPPRTAAPLSGDSRVTRHPSPDGRFELFTTAHEMRMSHWIEVPALIETASSRTVLAVDEIWSADTVAWSDDSRTVTLQLRKYPADIPGVTLAADLLTGEATFTTRAGVETARLEEANAWLSGYARRFGR